MTKPITTIEYSTETEADRILFVSYYARIHFYQAKKFYVLPYQVPRNQKTIYLPNLPILHNSSYWKELPINTEEIFTRTNVNYSIICTQLREIIGNNKPAHETIIQWSKVQDEFWKLCYEYFPNVFEKYTNLIIRPTLFGSICSQFSSETESKDLCIYIRDDATILNLFETILMVPISLVNNSHSILTNSTWEEREAIVDFLLEHTRFFELAKSVAKLEKGRVDLGLTLQGLRSLNQPKLANDSKEYLTKLGITDQINIEKLSDSEILINDQKIFLTENESTLFNLLFTNRNRIVSIDSIADELWKDKVLEKFSLAAITKLIQRLRKKFSAVGITPEIIETHRNQGIKLVEKL